MTSQTKLYIETSDIVALRIECGCGSAVSTPINGFLSIPQSCSNCGTPFIGYESPRTLQETFNEVVSSLQKVQRIADHRKFKFTLEITEPMQSTSQTSTQAQ
jgi:hypothetical protein